MKKIIVSTLIGMFVSLSLSAQEAVYFGDELYKDLKFTKAIDYYLKAIDRKPTVEAMEKLATCYRYTGNAVEAARWYGNATAYPKSKAIDYYYWGMMLKMLEQYDLAKEKFSMWATKEPAKIEVAKERMASCDLAKAWIVQPVGTVMTSQAALNSPFSEFGAVGYKNGIVFTSNRINKELRNENRFSRSIGKPFYKIYYADTITQDTSGFTILPFDKEINSKYNDGPCAFSRNQDTVWFTRTLIQKGRKNREKINRLQLYYCAMSPTGWQRAIPFKFNSGNYSTGHPSIGMGGKVLFFASDMPGGFGGMDLYLCTMTANGWSSPVNLGPQINTMEDELFPFYDDESNSLFFSSAAHSSMGGLDIFKSAWVNYEWTKPKNLKVPYNSSKDDFSFSLLKGKNIGYLSSNRGNVSGNDDVFQFRYEENNAPQSNDYTVFVKPSILGATGAMQSLTDVTISLKNITRGSKIDLTANADGTLFFTMSPREQYRIELLKEGFFKYTQEITVADLKDRADVVKAGNNTLVWSPEMRKLLVGECIVLQNIYYDYNSADLRRPSLKELDKVATLMIENPNISIQIGSHTDSRGDDDFNMRLSRKRAESAVKYIISLGIAPERIVAKGYGETEPINKCVNGVTCTEQEYQLNRRTDFRIIGVIPDRTIINQVDPSQVQ